MIEIHTLRALSDNFVYVLTHDRAAVVIDPGEAAPVLKFLESRGLELRQILLTHHHPDHVAGVGALVARTPVEVTCSVADLGRIAGATRGVAAGETLEVLGAPVEVLETPGHTLGHVAFYLPRESAVFTGDTLFSAGCGPFVRRHGRADVRIAAPLGRASARDARVLRSRVHVEQSGVRGLATG